MKKILSLLVLAFAQLILNDSVIAEQIFSSCKYITAKDTKTSGRFIFKPSGAHFVQAVIVAPRKPYFPTPPIAELFTADGKKIERLKLKSTGQCGGWRECLFAATFLAQHSGSWYGRQYGAVLVKFTARTNNNSSTCKYYKVSKPKARTEFKG